MLGDAPPRLAKKTVVIRDDSGAEAPIKAARGEPVVARHPRRTCILGTFGVSLALLTVLFFAAGFSMNRPLLGSLFLASIVPSLFILYVAYHKELAPSSKLNRGVCTNAASSHNDKVPLEVLVIAFSLGIMITIPVGLIGGIIQSNLEGAAKGKFSFAELFLYTVAEAFIFTACVEEGAKYFCARLSVNRDSLAEYVGHPYGVVLFALSSALGFAALENVTYVMGENTDEASWALAIVRALLSVPLHGTTGTLIGVGLARRHFFRDTAQSIPMILAMPVFIHGLYDFIWMAPLRNGAFKQPPNKSSMQNGNNTLDIGDWLGFLYIFNVVFVFWAASYAITKAKAFLTIEVADAAASAEAAEAQREDDVIDV